MRKTLTVAGAFVAGAFFFSAAPAWGQVPVSPGRERLVMQTLNRMQQRDAAMAESMQEAQLKLVERRVARAGSPPSGASERRTAKTGKNPLKGFFSKSHPYLITQVSFNDNLDEDTLPEKSDWIYSITPGFRTSNVSLGKSTAFDMHLESTYNQKRAGDNAGSLTASLDQTMSLGLYSFTIGNSITSNYINTEKLGWSDTEMDRSIENSFSTSLGRAFNRYGFNVGYARLDTFNEPVNRNDNMWSDVLSVAQFLRLGTRTRLSMDYAISREMHPRGHSGDSRGQEWGLSLAGVLSPKVSVSSGIDYGETDAKSGDDSHAFAFTQNIGYRFSDRTNFSFAFSRLRETFVDDEARAVTNSYTFAANHRLAFNPKLNLGFSYVVTDELFPSSSIPSQDQNTRTIGLGLSYAFKQWLDFSFGYSRKRVSSSIEENHNVNLVTITSSAKF
jgi:hypothetical protein